MILFHGDSRLAYRDPACYYHKGTYYLFFTLSEKKSGYMYNHVAMSQSSDLKNWSEPRILTPSDYELNYCSPGNIVRDGDEFVLCFTSYPMPYPYDQCFMADESARLFTMRTKDFETFSSPELLNPKGDTPVEDLGRMIDPFILKTEDCWYLFFKQNGVSCSRSRDLKNWEFLGAAQAGENACVLSDGAEYILVHSPENGISFARSKDLKSWQESSHTTLGQQDWQWAQGRLTAGFVMEAPTHLEYKYIMFYHGSQKVYPETHGNASLAIAFTNDFKEFFEL